MPSEATDVHGHDVLRMMLETGQSYDANGLENAILDKFGHDTRFCTCSASGMTAGELVSFLSDKGKFVPAGDGFTTEPERICDH